MTTTARRLSHELLLSLFGCSLVGVAIVHAVQDPGPLAPRLLELATVTGLSLSFMLAGFWMARRLEDEHFRWVVYSTIGLGLLTGTLSWIASGTQLLEGYSLNEPIYYGMTMMSGGAAAGPYLGYFYGKLQQRNAELSHRHEEMQVLNRRLSVANRVLRHNLRNNLTVIAGVTDDLRRRETVPFDDRLALLDRQATELTTLSAKMGEIRQVWETNERTTVDLGSVVERVIADIRSDHPDLTVRTTLPESAAVTAHPKLEVAVREVLTNAVEHNDTSTLSVDVEIYARDEETLTLRIADSGSGLPDSEAALFDESNPTMSALDHGVGLGLWLVYWTVEKSGGSFSVSNDDGAVVDLELPRAQSDAEPGLVRPTRTLQRKQPA